MLNIFTWHGKKLIFSTFLATLCLYCFTIYPFFSIKLYFHTIKRRTCFIVSVKSVT